MSLDQVVRDVDGENRSVLLCGRQNCSQIAHAFIEFEWNTWSGLIGACDEHHEDLEMLRIRAREAEGKL